ncbi:hypothetical protein MVEN_01646300 [Mycena venus]|uniref:Uncharacterized protein n=1 Tax=Mycena venus TaxID=2733690 RepID=A0A8H7CQT8_9AGAR|nr:hypothetical protein MVEN_01646300 [Mycena venus]
MESSLPESSMDPFKDRTRPGTPVPAPDLARNDGKSYVPGPSNPNPPPGIAVVPAAPTLSSIAPAHNTHVQTPSVPSARFLFWTTLIAFVIWSSNIPVSLVEYFRLAKRHTSRFTLGITLLWLACSSIFVIFTAIIFVSTVLRRPSQPFVASMRRLAICMAVTSTLVACCAFPVLGGCDGDECSGKEGIMRAMLRGGIAGASLWTIAWVYSIHEFCERL